MAGCIMPPIIVQSSINNNLMRKSIILYALCVFAGNMSAQSFREMTKERVFEALENEMRTTSQAVQVMGFNSDSCFVDLTVSQSAFPYVMTIKGGETECFEGKQANECKATVTITGNGVLTEDSSRSIYYWLIINIICSKRQKGDYVDSV